MEEHKLADLRGLRSDDEAVRAQATVTTSWSQNSTVLPQQQSMLNNIAAHLHGGRVRAPERLGCLSRK
jgi:hypothetical protein